MNGRRMQALLAAGLMVMVVTVNPCRAQTETAPLRPEPATGIQITTARNETLRIAQAVICRDVADRRPVSPGEVFSGQVGALYCFTHVLGAAAETRITHNWYYEGTLKASVQLPVRGADWRTWSRKTILPQWTGEWMVEVLGEDDMPLESLVFHVE